jgi:Rod binding domain-containing protein
MHPLERAEPSPNISKRDVVLREKAQVLEASFLSEMLSYAGLTEQKGAFAGGIGEERFASFLRQEQANLMVAKGGIGLAEQLFQSLSKKDAKE